MFRPEGPSSGDLQILKPKYNVWPNNKNNLDMSLKKILIKFKVMNFNQFN
jgi:hypothetical protein